MNIEAIKAAVKLHEGCISHMYLDTRGYVTVGVGFMLPDASAAEKLRFVYRQNQLPAPPVVIADEYSLVKQQQEAMLAQNYRQYCQLELPMAEIDGLLEDHIHEFADKLRSAFHDFDNYPEVVQEALLDMSFNLGFNGLISKFPKFCQAVRNRDWHTCGQECHRNGIGQSRNDYTRELFKNAN